MTFHWLEKVYGWWSVTGVVGKGGAWFIGYSRRPPSANAGALPPTSDPRVKRSGPGQPTCDGCPQVSGSARTGCGWCHDQKRP